MTPASKSKAPSQGEENLPKSQNGWPASPDPELIGIDTFRIPGTLRTVRLAKKAAPLLLAFAAEFHKKVEKIDKGIMDDWSYAYREIRGSTTTLSNHASGTALDLNATKHPLGVNGTFTKEQRVILKHLTAKYGLRAGEFYDGRVDGMHFEIWISQAEAKALIAKLNLGPKGRVQKS